MRYHITKAARKDGYWHIEAINKSRGTDIVIDITTCALLRYEKYTKSGVSIGQPAKARTYKKCCNLRTWNLYNGVTIQIDAKRRTVTID
jgi:hypothetical protein